MPRSLDFMLALFRPRRWAPLPLTLLLTIWLSGACPAQPAVAVRLTPGQDLKQELLRVARDNEWEAACVVTCVGSLESAHLRLADQSEGTRLEEKLEIVSLVGTFSQDGGHFHLAVSDSQGQTMGGHLLEGCRIYTTAELVIMPLSHYRFPREHDPATGHPELRPVSLP